MDVGKVNKNLNYKGRHTNKAEYLTTRNNLNVVSTHLNTVVKEFFNFGRSIDKMYNGVTLQCRDVGFLVAYYNIQKRIEDTSDKLSVKHIKDIEIVKKAIANIPETQKVYLKSLPEWNTSIQDVKDMDKAFTVQYKYLKMLKTLKEDNSLSISEKEKKAQQIYKDIYYIHHKEYGGKCFVYGSLLLEEWSKSRKIYRGAMSFIEYLKDSLNTEDTLEILKYFPVKTFAVCADSEQSTIWIIHIDNVANKVYMLQHMTEGKPQMPERGYLHRGRISVTLSLNKTIKEAIETAHIFCVNEGFIPYLQTGGYLGYYRVGVFGSVINLQKKEEIVLSVAKKSVQNTNTLSILSNNLKEQVNNINMKEPLNSGRVPALKEIKKVRALTIEKEESIRNGLLELIAFMHYIASVNAEIVTTECPVRMANNTQNRNTVQVNTAGVRITEFLSKYKGKYVYMKGNRGGKGKCKHIRRGHWHRYWVGKKGSTERKLILKFIAPILVHGTMDTDLPISIEDCR